MIGYNKHMKKEKGQIILGLILIMVVALGVGLSIVQKSLVDVSTSTKVEESSRAFSAAEAGIEKALKTGNTEGVNFTENNSSAVISDYGGQQPLMPSANTRQGPLEFPSFSKEEIAHVWLASPLANLPTCSATDVCYKQTTLDVYWGNSAQDRAAIELTLVYYGSTPQDPTLQFRYRKWYLDHTIARNPPNGFDTVTCSGSASEMLGSKQYQCKKTLGNLSGLNNEALPTGLMLLRARLLYNTTSQPFAVQSATNCPASGACNDFSIPPQARQIVSIGTSGQTQRRIRIFQIDKVVPTYFDFAVFSQGEIKK